MLTLFQLVVVVWHSSLPINSIKLEKIMLNWRLCWLEWKFVFFLLHSTAHWLTGRVPECSRASNRIRDEKLNLKNVFVLICCSWAQFSRRIIKFVEFFNSSPWMMITQQQRKDISTFVCWLVGWDGKSINGAEKEFVQSKEHNFIFSWIFYAQSTGRQQSTIRRAQ